MLIQGKIKVRRTRKKRASEIKKEVRWSRHMFSESTEKMLYMTF